MSKFISTLILILIGLFLITTTQLRAQEAATGPAPDAADAHVRALHTCAGIFFDPSVIDTTGLVSPAFNPVVHVFTTEYDAFGVHFSEGPPAPNVDTAIFNDPPLAWAGVSSGGIVNLIAPVDGQIVVPATGGIMGQTSCLEVEAGFSEVGSLLLEAYDCNGNLIGSAVNDGGIGPNGRMLMILNIPGISSFRVSTPVFNGFGVDSILMEQPTQCPPEPPKTIPTFNQWGLMALAGVLGIVGFMVIRRRKLTAN